MNNRLTRGCDGNRDYSLKERRLIWKSWRTVPKRSHHDWMFYWFVVLLFLLVMIAAVCGATTTKLSSPKDTPSVNQPMASAVIGSPPTLDYHYMPLATTVQAGDPASVYVVMSGTEPLTYQWWVYRRKVSAIQSAPGAMLVPATALVMTTNLYAVTNSNTNALLLTPARGGNYFVIVTNAYGSFTSQTATVTITPLPPRPNVTLTLSWTAQPNADHYTVETSTDLASWQPFLTTAATNAVFDWMKTNGNGLDPRRFYRAGAYVAGKPALRRSGDVLEWDAFPYQYVAGYELNYGPNRYSTANVLILGNATNVMVVAAPETWFTLTYYDWWGYQGFLAELGPNQITPGWSRVPCATSLVIQQ